jgi:arsenate reductase-like glutaredoxin family protein
LKSGLKPFDLVRQQEDIFKRELKGKHFTDEEWKRILLENPKLLVRPVLVGKYKAVLAHL